MSNSELITIGAFARDCGLTPSALRFYADYGVLVPAVVDPVSGYRYYAAGQRDRAVLIRRLRELDMPLERIVAVLETEPADAARLIDEHVDGLAHRVREARRVVADIGASEPSTRSVRLRGITFAAAVDQVLSATAAGPDFPVLTGVLIEASADSLILTATDRYRLSNRTLVPLAAQGGEWTRMLSADDLRLTTAWMRQQHELTIVDREHAIRIHGDNAETRDCRVLDEQFPDYRMVFSGLGTPQTRVVVSRHGMLEAIEAQPDRRIRLDITEGAITVSYSAVLPANVTGPPVTIFFAVKTLYPAISTALGAEVMIDITAADQPVLIRSADIGDLSTLAMPVSSEKGNI